MKSSIRLAWVLGLCLSGVVRAQVSDEQSRSGPEPPPGTPPKVIMREPGDQHIIAGVPGYAWRHGCGPTAVGMVVGYYDTIGYSRLIPGDANTQTAAVSQAIASQGSGVRGSGEQRHYEDYSLPMDSGLASVLADSSPSYPTGCHVNDSIADFMQTSWSKNGSFYGWGFGSRVSTGFTSYVNLVHSGYSPTSSSHSYSSLWSRLKTEVDNNRPMVFLVDTDGNGGTDHFVTVIGYEDASPPMYGCLDTWAPVEVIRWSQFRSMSSSYTWGISSGWSFSLRGPADPLNAAPVNVATHVSPTPTLSWSNGGAATSYDVYLGTSAELSRGDLQGNRTDTTFTSGLLAASTKYYWRVDAKNSYGTTPGETWSFTTAAAADFDCDGDADQQDLARFVTCLTGTNQGPPTSECTIADLDRDGDVDQSDFGVLQRCLTAGGVMVDPNCER